MKKVFVVFISLVVQVLSIHPYSTDYVQTYNIKRTKWKEYFLNNDKVNNLVILMRFKDHRYKELPSPSDYRVLFNSPNITDITPTGSIRKYYQHQSNNRANINNVVFGWIDTTITEKEATNGCSGFCIDSMLGDAIKEVFRKVDNLGRNCGFMKYFDLDGDGYLDMLTLIHSGYGAEWGRDNPEDRIISHAWGISESIVTRDGTIFDGSYTISTGLWDTKGSGIARIGIIAHEMGHGFGLPDLYDQDSMSISVHDLMADSWGLDGEQRRMGSLSPWSKIELGWIEPIELTHTQIVNTNQNKFFKLPGYSEGEMVLVEYRDSGVIWDSLLPGGFLVWHIDNNIKTLNKDNYYPGTKEWPEKHPMVRIIQADGLFEHEKELYYSYDPGDWYYKFNQVLSDTTSPNLQSYYNGPTGNKLFGFINGSFIIERI